MKNKKKFVSPLTILSVVILGIIIVSYLYIFRYNKESKTIASKNILLVNTLIDGKQLTPQRWDEFIKNGKKNQLQHLLYSYNPATQEKKVISEISNAYIAGLVDESEVSPDATKLYYYVKLGKQKEKDEIHIVSKEGDILIPIISEEWGVPWEGSERGASKERHCRWSPDSQFLACKLVKRLPPPDLKRIFKITVYNVNSGSIKDIYTSDGIDVLLSRFTIPSFLGWNENNDILTFQTSDNVYSQTTIQSININTSETKQLGIYKFATDITECPATTLGEILTEDTIFLCFSNHEHSLDKRVLGMAEVSMNSYEPSKKIISLDGYYVSFLPSNNKNYLVWSESDIKPNSHETTVHIYDIQNKNDRVVTLDKKMKVRGYIEELDTLVIVPESVNIYPIDEILHTSLYDLKTKQEIEIGGQYVGYGDL